MISGGGGESSVLGGAPSLTSDMTFALFRGGEQGMCTTSCTAGTTNPDQQRGYYTIPLPRLDSPLRCDIQRTEEIKYVEMMLKKKKKLFVIGEVKSSAKRLQATAATRHLSNLLRVVAKPDEIYQIPCRAFFWVLSGSNKTDLKSTR